MERSTHRWFSPALGHDMSLNTYGDGGRLLLVFPSQEGRFTEYEDFGMVEEVRTFIDERRLQLVCLDGIDAQSWCNPYTHPRSRALRHNDYERYLIGEVMPFVRQRVSQDRVLVTGCSMGAYHASNFFFRHPDLAHGLLALSGVYDLTLFIGDAMDEEIYLHVPLSYLPSLEDPWYLDRYRRAQIVLCVGQGDWEEPMLTQTLQMRDILFHKGIAACVEVWGHDVSHDWPWWRRQLTHFLERLGV